MNVRFCFLVFQLMWSTAWAGGLSFDGWGASFKPPKTAEVFWAASTHHLPNALWVYRVIPSKFSSAVVSNMMALGGWTMNQRTNIPGRPPSRDKDFLHFGGSNGAELGISSRVGAIEYVNERARASARGRAADVPKEDLTLHLAWEFLKEVEIDPGQFAKDTNGSFKVFRGREEQTRNGITEVISRDVYLIRQLDGVEFAGLGNYGGVRISFGDRGKIAEVLVLWPQLDRESSHRLASPKELCQWIKDGKSVIAPRQTTGEILGQAENLKRITIRSITPLYMGGNEMEPKQPGDSIHPFAALEVTVNLGHTNLPAVLNCPIIEND